jgi:hypothetical protein
MRPPRRAYWLSMAALVVALPAAVAVQVWGNAVTWRTAHERVPVEAATGEPVDYAGARWTVTRFTRLAGSAGRAVVLAEFEAAIADPQALGAVPCVVGLSDADGRTWQPVLFADPIVQKMYPETTGMDLCGGPTFATAQAGKPARMTASFVIPASARDLKLSITLFSALPAYLSVSEPGA